MKGEFQRNIWNRYDAIQSHVKVFHGYVQGRQESGDEASLYRMAQDFQKFYGMQGDSIQSLLQSRSNLIEVIRALNKTK